jgi:hypothetical protein
MMDRAELRQFDRRRLLSSPRRMTMKYFVLVFALACAGLIGCSSDDDDVTKPPVDQAAADSISQHWFAAMTDTMQRLIDETPSSVQIRTMEFHELRNGFQQALLQDSGNGLAHLGLSMVSLLEVNYSPELWAMIDSLVALDEGSLPIGPYGKLNPLRDGIIGHQFRILAEAPMSFYQQTQSIPSNLTWSNFQNMIHDAILPKLDQAISQVGMVEADADFEFIGEMDGSVFEIDLGEVYFFDAALRATRGGLRMMTAYQTDLFGPDGTYGWIEHLDPVRMVPPEVDRYEVLPGPTAGDTLRISEYDYGWYAATGDSIMAAVLRANLQSDSSFLTLRTDPYSGQSALQGAYEDVGAVLAKIESAVEYIRAEEGDQENDIIKVGYLTDLDGEISCGDDPDCPSFAADWETLEDVIDWLQIVLSGPYDLEETINGFPISIRIDLTAWLHSPVQDWKTKLPYHRWLDPAQRWLEEGVAYSYVDNWTPGADYCVWIQNEGEPDQLCFPDIYRIWWIYHTRQMVAPPAVLLDGPDGDPLAAGVFPYLPDYTLGGLFPEMTRGGWLALWSLIG